MSVETHEAEALIAKWRGVKMQRGKPTCPCGFIGGPRNIALHRTGCDVWKTLIEFSGKEAKARGKQS